MAADKNFERNRDGLAGLLRGAGLTGVRCDRVSWVHRADPDDWWSGPVNGLGAFGELVRAQTPAMQVRLRSEYDRLAAAHLDPDGMLAMPTAALLASGTVP